MKIKKLLIGCGAIFAILGLISCSTTTGSNPIEEEVKYTVTYDYKNGNPSTSIQIQGNQKIVKPSDPTKEDFIFKGWYQDEDYQGEWNFDEDVVTKNMTLFAKWEKMEKYSISYNMHGHGAAPANVAEATTLPNPLPTVADVESWHFVGWYLDDAFTALAEAGKDLTENVVLHAKWEDVSTPTPPTPEKYSISYNMHGHGAAPTNVAEATTVPNPLPTVVDVEGWHFVGWYLDDAFTTLAEAGKSLTENVVLHAKWEVNKYTVTFVSNDGSTVNPQVIEYNQKATRPVPTREGYIFAGWYKDEAYNHEFDFNNTPITANITLYAKWVERSTDPDKIKVIFNPKDGVLSSPAEVLVEVGSKVAKPTDPTRVGYTFKGWFEDPTNPAGVPFDFANKTITVGFALYAEWEINKYTVTFDSKGGSTVNAQVIEYNQKATRPEPTREGYIFSGWYKDEAYNHEFDFNNTTITDNITLYAKWVERSTDPEKVKVIFNPKDGVLSSPAEVLVEVGGKVTKPTDPTRVGYTFKGWFEDPTDPAGAPFDFENKTITTGFTLYAKWEKDTYSIYYVINGKGEQPNNEEHASSLPETLPVLTDSTFVFAGWYLDEGLLTKATPGMILTEDVTLYAKWVNQSTFNIDKAEGYLEGAYLEWKAFADCTDYHVYYKKINEADSSYIKIDQQLIRQYPNKYRADILGLAAGNYTVKAVPVKDSQEVGEGSKENVMVVAHERSGFAFSQNSKFKTGSGAYNDDGTLKNNAVVVYVTAKNAKTVSCSLNINGTSTQLKGLQGILDGKQSANSTQPLCIRFLGLITKEDLDALGSSSEGLQIKGKSAFSELNTTIEGVGEDATLSGFGFLVRNCGNVEFRNFAIMNQMDDGISIDTDNCNIWVHNLDIYYGKKGSGDKAKGDGSVDTKLSTNVTISYNHFWDSGKCNLQGMKEEKPENYITYHHNWYDHSDSRHPRIRTCTVHIYNNYFDGNAKYGVGVTTGASAFVENNYFRNCKNPMMSAAQGTDALGDGTFSGENGGIIKAYGNHIEGGSDCKVISYQENSTSFDAYVATSRGEQLPSAVKTLAGSTTYNNFDTNSSLMYTYSIDTPEVAKEKVIKYAGRVNGGDLKWTFDNATQDRNYAIIPELSNAILTYKATLIRVLGIEGTQSGGNTGGGEQGGDTPGTGEVDPPAITDSIAHNFTTDGKDSSVFTITGNLATNKGTVTYKSLTLTQCLKLESSTNISFSTSETMTLVLVFAESSATINVDGKKQTATNGIISISLAAGSHSLTKANTANLFYIELGKSS